MAVTYESVALGGTELNDSTNYRVVAMEAPPPKKKLTWIQGADSDGAALIRDPLYENRVITLKVRIAPQATMNAALQKVSAINALLKEATVTPGGMTLVWGPAGTTLTQTAYVLSGEITEMPITKDGGDQGWFFELPTPVVTLELQCRPFLYGDEVTEALGTSSTPILTDTIAGVPGDVPAEARLVVTESAGQARRYLEWGIEQRYYNAATSLIVDSDNMVASGFSGSQASVSGAYDPNLSGNNAIRATIYSSPVSICGTNNLSHVGVFRVKARVQSAPTDTATYVRLCWRVGSGMYEMNEWAQPTATAGWCEVDLGVITIPAVALGTQQWDGYIQAYTTATPGTFDVDYLVLVPALEGYGRARGVNRYMSGGVTRFDDFDSGIVGNNINTRVADLGGSWTSSVVIPNNDWKIYGNPYVMYRYYPSDANPETARLGAAMTDTDVSIVWATTNSLVNVSTAFSGVVARWGSASNFLRATLDCYEQKSPAVTCTFALVIRIGGVNYDLARSRTLYLKFNPYSNSYLTAYYTIRLVVYATGHAVAFLLDAWGNQLQRLSGYHSALAASGSLASGTPGMTDYWPSADGASSIRWFGDFTVGTPLADAVVINASRTAQIRWDGIMRVDSGNTVWGDQPSYQGTPVLVPPAGPNSRTSRILIKAHREDIEAEGSTYVTDSLGATLYYRPRYLTPRGA